MGIPENRFYSCAGVCFQGRQGNKASDKGTTLRLAFQKYQRGTQGALRGACPRAWGRGGIPGQTSPLMPIILLMGSCVKASGLLFSQTILGQEGHSKGTDKSRGVSRPSNPPSLLSSAGLRGASRKVSGFPKLAEETEQSRPTNSNRLC